jgi:hypothetical protein
MNIFCQLDGTWTNMDGVQALEETTLTSVPGLAINRWKVAHMM